MAVAETARLVVDLSLKGNFAKQLQTSGRALGKFDAQLDRTESRAFRAGQQIGTGIKRAAAIGAVGIGLLAVNVKQGLDSLVELEKQQAQTEAAIKSTGRVAGITAGRVRELAEEFESMNATVGDEVIQETENLLLTFTNIRKKAFKPALQAILDINTRLGKGPEGLAGTARQVGKALQDPTKGLQALTRIGITFDKKTTARIKTLQKQGKLFQAQDVILKELNRRFGGSFLAEGGTTGGKVAKFNDAIEDLQRTLATGLLPVVSNIADALSELFRDPAVQKGVAEFGQNLAKVFSPGAIKSGIATVKDVFSTIAAVAGPAASAVGTMVAAFNRLPPDLRNLLIGAVAVNKLTGGLVTNVAGGLASALGAALKTIVAANVTVVGKNVVGPGGGLPGGPPGATKPGVPRGGLTPAIGAGVIIDRQFMDQQFQEFKERLGSKIDASKKDTVRAQNETKRETTRGAVQTQASVRSSSQTNAAIISSAQNSAATRIVSAIYAARPVVNVTNVQKTTTIQNRYGPGNGSSGRGSSTGSDSNLPP